MATALLKHLLLATACALPLASLAQPVVPAVPSAGKQLFVRPVALRGTLGDAPVQIDLRTKQEYADGVEGEYFVFGSSQKVLLAGEIEGDEVFLEESENGTDVSGQWNGKLAGEVFSGEWLSADGTRTKPFSVRIVRSARSQEKTR
ncbi:MAG TPA: hypothetical protein VIM12_20145 [Noviherbaspirillum sp.]|jgi:hypothetical protein|uniref:hypothetical protein n=1 Tax=Noviherbaspirillum sp. TaxID=1926288 RepID=UPI002F926877